jgi:hypothetical protein
VGKGGTVVVDDAGTGSSLTRGFQLPGEWTLRWSFDCAGAIAGPGVFSIEVVEVQRPHRVDLRIPRVLRFDQAGSGSERYAVGGYRAMLRVTSQCPWTLRVVDLRA